MGEETGVVGSDKEPEATPSPMSLFESSEIASTPRLEGNQVCSHIGRVGPGLSGFKWMQQVISTHSSKSTRPNNFARNFLLEHICPRPYARKRICLKPSTWKHFSPQFQIH